MFSPLVGLAWEPKWSRVYETFGEDPLLVGRMAYDMTRGIQEIDVTSGIRPSRAAASAKHWLGYSLPRDGHDRAPSWIPRRHLYQYFLPPWKETLKIAKTVMESYTEISGVPNVENREVLDTILRKKMGYDGMVVTDYSEIFNLADWHHTAENRTAAVIQSLQEGAIDMSMIPWDADVFLNALQNSEGGVSSHVHKERISKSAKRVLQLKDDLNMFEETITFDDNANTHMKPNPDEIQKVLDMTHQSIILTENKDSTLPISLSSDASGEQQPLKVLVTGPTSNSLSYQTGGWTWNWQGADPSIEREWFTYGSTVLEQMQQEPNWEVSYECGTSILGGVCENPEGQDQDSSFLDTVKGWVGWGEEDASSYYTIQAATKAAKNKDLVVVCVGEENYTEKPGDIRSLRLPQGQYELVEALKENTSAKIVLVYFGGRPRLLQDMVDHVDAVLVGFLPGPLAGQAIADIVTGRVNPSGRLPITYPKYEDGGGSPYLHSVSDQCTKDTDGPLPHWENIPCETQWPFGHGLSYTSFTYSDLSLSTNELVYRRSEKPSSLTITARVKNTGDRPGSDVAMIYTFDEFRSTTPEYKRLRSYEKITLNVGESKLIKVTLPVEDFRFVGPHDDSHYILQNGLRFRVGVGAADCRMNPDSPACSDPVTVTLDNNYVAACEAACNLWQESDCFGVYGFSMDRCWDMCSSIHQDSEGNLQMNNDGWGWNYVNCIEELTWKNNFASDPSQCWKMTTMCRDITKTSQMDELGQGSIRPTHSFMQQEVSKIILAFASGLLVSTLILSALRGRRSSKNDDRFGDVEFSRVHEDETAIDMT